MADDEKREQEEEASPGASPEGEASEDAAAPEDVASAEDAASADDAASAEDAEDATAGDGPLADKGEEEAGEGRKTDGENPVEPKRRKKSGRKKKPAKTTAGQRLAAAKAAKAAKKAAARGKGAEILEDKATERAALAATWFERNHGKLRVALLAAVVLLGLVVGWDFWSSRRNAEASRLLWEATQTLNAPIVAQDAEEAPEEEDEEHYDSLASRADAALEKLDAMLDSYGGSRLAPYALLLRGKALYQKGEYAAAREAWEKALAEGDETVRARALEGVAFTYEAEENWDEALARYEELREDNDRALLADYHIARVHLARGEEVEAKEKLRAILDAFREEDAPELPFVRDQAELRLMAIDSSLVQRDVTPDADALRRLIQEQLSKQGSRGG